MAWSFARRTAWGTPTTMTPRARGGTPTRTTTASGTGGPGRLGRITGGGARAGGLWNGPNDRDSGGDGRWDGWHDDGDPAWEAGEVFGERGDPGAGGAGGFGTLHWGPDTADAGLWGGGGGRG